MAKKKKKVVSASKKTASRRPVRTFRARPRKISSKRIKIRIASEQAKEDEYNKCLRCDRRFPSRDALKKHQRSHMQALKEIKMLEEGFVPTESKIGQEFKGKNRIIIS